MAERDPIIDKSSGGGGSPKRSDKLNGENRTKSIDGGGANYSNVKPSDNSAPPPNNPYK